MTGRRAFEYTTRASQVVDAPEWVQAQLMDERDRELEDFVNQLLGNGTWTLPLLLGAYNLWVDDTGDLRIKSTPPTSDTDGTVVGTQT